MRIDGDAAAVIGHAQETVGIERHLDAGGVAGDRLVHGIVERLGKEMMQRLLVGAADIHARAPAHGLEPLQHLDVGCGVAAVAAGRRRALAAAGSLGGERFLLQLILDLGKQVA